MKTYIEYILRNPKNRIAIVSGEGTGNGTIKLFNGRRTRLAISRRLTRERNHGDRWAYAVIETNSPKRCAGHAVRWDGGDECEDRIFPDM